jgi:hypothetical protein
MDTVQIPATKWQQKKFNNATIQGSEIKLVASSVAATRTMKTSLVMCARERSKEQNSAKLNDILTATITICCCQYITWLRRNYFENNLLRTQRTKWLIHLSLLIVVFPCMLVITQLLFQQNALVY